MKTDNKNKTNFAALARVSLSLIGEFSPCVKAVFDSMNNNSFCTVIVPPMIEVHLTGVQLARLFPSGVVALEYVDGNSESASLTVEQLAAGRENFFSLVSAVQSQRGPSSR